MLHKNKNYKNTMTPKPNKFEKPYGKYRFVIWFDNS